MKYRVYHKLFWAAMIIAVCIGSGLDLLSFRQSDVTDRTGNAVVRSYKFLEQLSAISTALRDNSQARLTGHKEDEAISVARVVSHYKRALQLTGAQVDAPQFESLNFLDSDLDPTKMAALIQTKYSMLRRTIWDSRIEAETNVERLIAEDSRENRISRNRILTASVFDLLLLLAVAVLWCLYDKKRRRDEALLSSAIKNSSRTNAELLDIIQSRTRQLRSTLHDLKNPLGSIKGFSDLLNEERHNPTSVAEMSQTLQRLSSHTLELVNSLVAAEAQVRPPTAPELNIVACIDDVCAALRPQIRMKDLTLFCLHDSPEAMVHGDRHRLWDVFTNLVGNAIKYSPPRSTLRVRTRVEARRVIIEIEDEGPGFTAEDKARAFGAFQKLSAKPTGGEVSSGLGLHVARNIVRDHNGTIDIRDGENGRGACLIIELPFENPTSHLLMGPHGTRAGGAAVSNH